MTYLKYLLIPILIVGMALTKEMPAPCAEKMFPLTVGGSGDDVISCMLHHESSGLIIVAGNSTSDDFVAAATNHAFVYAVSEDSNWKWGKFFYNESYSLNSVSGCQINSKD